MRFSHLKYIFSFLTLSIMFAFEKDNFRLSTVCGVHTVDTGQICPRKLEPMLDLLRNLDSLVVGFTALDCARNALENHQQ